MVEMIPQSTRAPRKWTPAENSLLQEKVEECSKGRNSDRTSIQTNDVSQEILGSPYTGPKLPQHFKTEVRMTAANVGPKWTRSGKRVHGTVVKTAFSVNRSKNTAAGGQRLPLYPETKC